MSDQSKTILNSKQLSLTINRLSFEIIENRKTFHNTVIIGMQPRGIFLSKEIHQILEFKHKRNY